MKDILIVTIIDDNYGNRLQNYAVQDIYRKLGHNPRTRVKNNRQVFKKQIKDCLKIILRRDDCNFRRFDFYINWTNNEESKFDVISVGSDQVWNTEFKWITLDYFLPFPHPRKISFSASFGVDSIPYDQKTVDCLNDFKALSVREEAGAKIIKELTGRDATVLVDPTMLLTKDEWRKVSKKPRGAKDGYIMLFLL